jgi:hypothetical protein
VPCSQRSGTVRGAKVIASVTPSGQLQESQPQCKTLMMPPSAISNAILSRTARWLATVSPRRTASISPSNRLVGGSWSVWRRSKSRSKSTSKYATRNHSRFTQARIRRYSSNFRQHEVFEFFCCRSERGQRCAGAVHSLPYQAYNNLPMIAASQKHLSCSSAASNGV